MFFGNFNGLALNVFNFLGQSFISVLSKSVAARNFTAKNVNLIDSTNVAKYTESKAL